MALIATMRCQPSGSASKNLIRASLCLAAVDMLMPAQLIRISSAPKVSSAWARGRPASWALDHSGAAVEDFSGKPWLGGGGIEPRRVDVDARDLGAGARERAGHHPPHAVRRPGNNGYAAREYLRLCHDA